MRRRHLSLALATLLMTPVTAIAEEITSVLHATVEWTGFTDSDGSGLYNELLREAFAVNGVDVQVDYVPLNRAVALVERGDADFTGGFAPDERNFAQIPIYRSTFAMMHRADADIGELTVEGLSDMQLVTVPQVNETIQANMNAVDGRGQAAKVLISGRAVGYVDLLLPLQRLRDTGVADLDVRNTTEAPFEINPDEWEITEIVSTQLYLLFPDTERGHAVRALYEEGTRAIAESGRLAEIYAAYDAEVPIFD